MKYKSTLFDEARNKIGSIVASKNRNGNYFRDRVTPHNPRSAGQVIARGLFTNLTQAWRGLTDEERAGWSSLAPQITLRDALSNTYHPTGQQLYISCNTNLTNVGLAVIDNAPAVPDSAPDLINLSCSATVMTASPHTQLLQISVSGGSTGQMLLINATAQYSPGRSFVGRSQFRVLLAEPLPVGSPIDAINSYNFKFGNLVVGSKLSVEVKGITVNGFAGQPQRQDLIVTAA